MRFSFNFADKNDMPTLLCRLFDILYCNMKVITPSGKTKEEDFDEWYSSVYPAMQKAQRQIVLMYAEDELVGFFQYYVNGGVFMMEEIQIEPKWQGSGIFGAMYSWLLPRLDAEIKVVEAYAHEKNSASMAILEHLGLCKQSQSREFLLYRGEYGVLADKYLKGEE